MRTYGIVGLNEGIVNGNDVDVLMFNGISEDDTTNTAESVDADLCGSHDSLASVKSVGSVS